MKLLLRRFTGKAGARSRADLAFAAAWAMWARAFRASLFCRSENTQVSPLSVPFRGDIFNGLPPTDVKAINIL